MTQLRARLRFSLKTMIKEVEMNTIHLEVFAAKDQSDVDIFWGLFNSYIDELSLHVSMGDEQEI